MLKLSRLCAINYKAIETKKRTGLHQRVNWHTLCSKARLSAGAIFIPSSVEGTTKAVGKTADDRQRKFSLRSAVQSTLFGFDPKPPYRGSGIFRMGVNMR